MRNPITQTNRALLFKTVKIVVSFLQILRQRVSADYLPHIAAALTFTSLLAIVPLFAISIAIINQLSVANEYLALGQDYIFKIFAPEFSANVKEYLQVFIIKTQKLTSIGIVAIAVTALLTLDTIEKTFNKIWHVKTSRNILMRFISYFVIIVLGPILIGVSLSLTTYISTLTLFNDNITIGKMRYYFFTMLPIFTTVIAFTLMYKLVPNIKVSLRHAISGGLVAAILFEIAKRGFTYFIASFSSYQVIYGALAVIPLTLIWIYVSWLIVLIGAEVTASLSDYLKSKTKFNELNNMDICSAVKIIGYIGFLNNRTGITTKDIWEHESQISDQRITSILAKLEQNELICQKNGQWYLSKDKFSYLLQELLVICYPCNIELNEFENENTQLIVNIQDALSKYYLDSKSAAPILLQQLYDN